MQIGVRISILQKLEEWQNHEWCEDFPSMFAWRSPEAIQHDEQMMLWSLKGVSSRMMPHPYRKLARAPPPLSAVCCGMRKKNVLQHALKYER